jgi:formamidopyrimidine-DNA glycosylase
MRSSRGRSRWRVPELPEVERYRQLAEGAALHRPIAAVDAGDAWFLKRGLTAEAAADALVGHSLVAARRRGKLLLLDTDGGPVVGLRFGMTGRLHVDDSFGVEQLQYSPAHFDPKWDRFALQFEDGGRLGMQDPRRLGGVELDPDEERLGPDALAITRPQLAAALAGSHVALKARLLDQSRVAGVGNLIADEILWRAGLAPDRPAGGLRTEEIAALHRYLRSGLRLLIRRGGAHTGDLGPHRRPGGHCPRDGEPLVRATIGGRTSWWCPRHQH